VKIAYTMAPGRGDTDLLLFGLAQSLAAEGRKTGGTVQINTEGQSHACDMDVKVLPDGPILRISQDLGKGSKGCRLDPSALETAVALSVRQVEIGVDLLIINKFGKHEAEGRGFRTVIADAIERDIPVLVGVNALNLAAFHVFVGPDADRLEPTSVALTSWCATAMRAVCPA
jgi:nucleoside-triphosphatase THEP1